MGQPDVQVMVCVLEPYCATGYLCRTHAIPGTATNQPQAPSVLQSLPKQDHTRESSAADVHYSPLLPHKHTLVLRYKQNLVNRRLVIEV